MTPGIQSLFKLAQLFLPDDIGLLTKQYESGSLKFVNIKDKLAAAITNELKSIQKKRKELVQDTSYVDDVISSGAEKARALASHTIKNVREKMGLL